MNSLRSRCIPVTGAGADLRDRMFDLMTESYRDMSRLVFEQDLSRKDEVILLEDEVGELVGFSTLVWNPGGLSQVEDIVFSGDTVIASGARGGQELVNAFCHRAGQRHAATGRPLYWFLLSKGHRTYSYLPLFAHRFHPDPVKEAPDLAELAGRCALHLFGEAWKPAEGIIRFENVHGALKNDLAEDAFKREARLHVRYFLERNPGFAEGDELVCMTVLDAENLRGRARRAFLAGVAQPNA